jgi:hypothetical protein
MSARIGGAGRALVALCFALTIAGQALAVPFWGAKTSQPADTDPATLKAGEFIWNGGAVPAGPIVVVVSVTEQRAYVYRNGINVGVSSVSTGKPGHDTPTGIFTVLQKDQDHHSSKYNDASMPYTERLTWDGVALHAGGLPGYPSSHGCVHLPSEFARLLFQISPMGMTVVVAAEHEAPDDVVHPAAIAPVDPKTGEEDEAPRLGANEDERWEPDKSPDGPVSILMSGADRRVLVYRNGIEIGRARLTIRDPEVPLGTHAYVMLEGAGAGTSRWAPGAPNPRWTAVAIPGHAGVDKQPLDPASVARVSAPPAFAKAVYGILAPGATLVVTDAPVLEQTTGVALNVVNGDPPAKE